MHSACQHFNFGRLLAIGPGFQLESDALPDVQGTKPFTFDGMGMHEYVQATILLDEAVTRFGTKPFDDTRGFHPLPPGARMRRTALPHGWQLTSVVIATTGL